MSQARGGIEPLKAVTIGGQSAADVVVEPATVESRGPFVLSDFRPAFSVDWNRLIDVRRSAETMPSGFTAAVTDGDGMALVGVDREDHRVWIGFDARGFDATADFIRFWVDVIDWVAEPVPQEVPKLTTRDLTFDADAVTAELKPHVRRADGWKVPLAASLLALAAAALPGLSRRGG